MLLNVSKFDGLGVNGDAGGSKTSAIDLGGQGSGSKSAMVIDGG